MRDLKSELAVYGKGGIGKSTICANLSAALAQAGRRVLQIGCDPKHDSTRLLLGGKTVPTVLDYLKDVPAQQADVHSILAAGDFGIGCIEAGGPKPGVGCAGRGIISAFEFLDAHHVKEDYEYVLYDVLGDVVCGGFAVPIRREYADAVFLVTSGEYMAIYAANNILRGILNYDAAIHRRVAGIIYNSRNLEEEYERIRRFAQAVHLPVCAEVPRSHAFAAAEEANRTVMRMPGYEREKEVFRQLAAKIMSGLPLYAAMPLEDDELERIVLGKNEKSLSALYTDKEWRKDDKEADKTVHTALPQEEVRTTAGDHLPALDEDVPVPDEDQSTPGAGSPPLPVRRPPLYGCAFNGAITTAVRLSDAIVIAHSPKSCAFYTWQNISSTGRKNLFDRGILMPSAISPNFESTGIGENEVIFGGMDALREQIRAAIRRRPGAVVVVSSCVSGIIGDDIRGIEEMSTDDVPVFVIPADGDIGGDYMEGIRMCLHTVARSLIRRDVPVRPRCVNLVGEVGVSNNIELNFRRMRSLLSGLDVAVNCRFLGDAKTAQVQNFLCAPLNILAHENADNRELKKWLQQEYGAVFTGQPFPVGFVQTKRFVEEIAAFFDCREKTASILEAEEAGYHRQIGVLRKRLAGRKILMTTISVNLDWLIYPAMEAGMRFVWIGVLDYLNQGIGISQLDEVLAVTERMHHMLAAREKIEALRPDLVVSNYTSDLPAGQFRTDSLSMTQTVGFESGIDVLKRWADLLDRGEEGEWQHDRVLYQKHFS